jgi:hypothetical protein
MLSLSENVEETIGTYTYKMMEPWNVTFSKHVYYSLTKKYFEHTYIILKTPLRKYIEYLPVGRLKKVRHPAGIEPVSLGYRAHAHTPLY